MSATYRIVLAEDEPRILHFLENKIQVLDPRFEVIGTARNGLDALSLIEELHPHALFSDVQMPVMNGLELLAKVKSSFPQMKSVIISGYRDFDYVREAMRYEAVDYLLKPIMDQDLLKLLRNIANELDQDIKRQKREAIASAVANRLDMTHSFILSPQQKYSIILISIGHLLNNSSQISYSRIFLNIWKKIDFTQLLKESNILLNDWWICDGWNVNHKFFIFDATESSSVASCLPVFLECLKLHANGYPVNLCMLPDSLSLHQLHQGVLQLQESIQQSLVPGQSQILPLQKGEKDNSHPLILTENQRHLLKSLIASGKTDEVKKQLDKLLHNWIEHQYPQVAFESGLRQLFRLIASVCSVSDENELYLIEYHTQAFLSTCRSPEELLTEIWEAASHLLSHQAIEKNYGLKTAEDVEQYIRQHYTEDISLDSIASMMGFHTVYLNRIFKKVKQVTPIQFLINLRIEKAKELIQQNPNWDFSTIGESVGYHDPHYFSRAFKKATGLSPSEYRNYFKNSRPDV